MSDLRAPSFTVRPLRRPDLPRVLEIEEISFATPWSSRTFINLMLRPNAAMFVAADPRDAVIGYAVVWFAGPEAELGDLAVHPDARGRGVGGALVESVIREALARGAREVFLEVRASNAAARRLYERAGFAVAGCRPGYYSDPVEDALIMRRELAR